jgi:pectinesterase
MIVLVSGVLPIFAQISTSRTIPRDTSFTIHSAFAKERIKFPFIEIVKPELPENVVDREGLVYSVINDTPYGTRELHLNLYRPNDKQKYPAVLMIHGGGWRSGGRSLQIPLAQRIASKGYVTAPVEYRLSPEASYPAAVCDVKAAVRWLRANADRYGIDPDRIAVSGCSAGAHLADLIGMTNSTADFEACVDRSGVSDDVQAVIDIDGIADFVVSARISRAREARISGKELPSDALWFGGTYEEKPQTWKDASPVSHVSQRSAPVCFINSSDRVHEGMERQIELLNNLNIYSEVHVIPNTPHPFWLFRPWFEPTVGYMISFLDKIFKPNQSSTK